MATHWVWSQVIITFISSRETRCSFPISRRVMPQSSLGSVVRHCFSFAFVRQYDIILSFDVTCAGGLLCPSFWSTSHRRWVCCSITICDATGFELMVTLVRFAPDYTSVLLCNSWGQATFHFTIRCCHCEAPLIMLLCNKLWVACCSNKIIHGVNNL